MFHNTSAINGRTTPVLRFENLLNLPPLPFTKLFFKEKRTKKKATETWQTIPERYKSQRVAQPLCPRRCRRPLVSLSLFCPLFSEKAYPAQPVFTSSCQASLKK